MFIGVCFLASVSRSATAVGFSAVVSVFITVCFLASIPLFYCGQFCAEYMNPVNFHTGLLVIKPSKQEFGSMLRALHDPKIQSYDGADQGFLTAYFPYDQMINAPLFDEKACKAKGGCENRLNRLPVGYPSSYS